MSDMMNQAYNDDDDLLLPLSFSFYRGGISLKILLSMKEYNIYIFFIDYVICRCR
jgi:hypothetical protein